MKSALYLVLCFSILAIAAEVRGGDPQTVSEKQVPKVLQKVNPEYPAEAKKQGIQGTVILDAMINEKGEVIEIKPQTDKEKVKEQPDPLLAKAAIDAVKQWKYEPYRDESGKVQPVRFSVTINFRLK